MPSYASAAVVAALAAMAPLGARATNPPLITDATTFQSQIVSLHNQLRAYHYLGSDTTGTVTWSATLAAGAQSWANQCEFVHSNSGAWCVGSMCMAR